MQFHQGFEEQTRGGDNGGRDSWEKGGSDGADVMLLANGDRPGLPVSLNGYGEEKRKVFIGPNGETPDRKSVV